LLNKGQSRRGSPSAIRLILVLCMHENPVHSVLMKTVSEIKETEEKYDKIIAEAKEKADGILRKAKEEIAVERAKVEEEITKYKNEQLRNGKEEIEKEVKRILEDAKEEAEKISKKRLNASTVLSISKSFISSL